MRKVIIGLCVVVLIVGAAIGIVMAHRYDANEEMVIPLEEVGEYPDDPSDRSSQYGEYAERSLRLVRHDDTHFDFIFESDDPKVATITFKNIDLSLFIPKQPSWITGDRNLETVFYTEREWNRQQVKFDPRSVHVDVMGGDGYERNNITSLELVRNCLNAGLWEVMFYVQEAGEKALYYQGWFNFPLGQYQDLFDRLNPVSYWRHWHRLEFWKNAEGTPVDLTKLRTVKREQQVAAEDHSNEAVFARGEQARKQKTVEMDGVRTWGDFRSNDVRFATFEKPGRYNMEKQWGNEYDRLATLDAVYLREVDVQGKDLEELELVFGKTRLLISGINLRDLPTLPMSEYPKGFYMPIGISLPPVYQDYEELEHTSPDESTYFSLMLDEQDRWLNHHEIAVDGIVLFKDVQNPNLIHLLLLSYERHTLVGHYTIQLNRSRISSASF